ncbi:MAG TPA: homoserine kinase [bacterium]|nr:homoserine kinase [bacterium]
MNEVKLIVPASTSNLGPGFDCLGLALDWPLQVSASREGADLQISLSGFGPPVGEGPLRELCAAAVREWEKKSGQGAGGVRLMMAGDIPLARGLGSSAAYRLGTLAAVNQLAGAALNEPEILDLAAGLERHTDNVTPCMVGGLTVSGWMDGRVHYVHYPVPERFRFVALIPEQEMETEKARAVLPESVTRHDAVFNMQRAIWLVNAIANGRPESLRGVFQDRLHQPSRERLVPFLSSVIRAAEQAGAFGAFLSGSGSTIIAVADEFTAESAAQAMLEALIHSGNQGNTRILLPDNRGLRVVR